MRFTVSTKVIVHGLPKYLVLLGKKQFTRDKMNIAVYMTISDHVFSPENSFRAFLFSKLNLNLNEGQSNPALRTPA